MGWERRKGGSGQYYTRSRRVNGRVRREYIGCREAAHLTAEMDAAAREGHAAQREMMAEQRRAEQARHDAMYAAILSPLDALDTLCRVAMRRELEAAGYHQHDRGEWRKRRGEKTTAGARTANGADAGRSHSESDEAARASAECEAGCSHSARGSDLDGRGAEGAGSAGI